MPVDGLRPRKYPAVAWVGERLFVFGGVRYSPDNSAQENLPNDGGLVNVTNGEMRRLPRSPFRPSLELPVAVAVGDTVVVFGRSCKASLDSEYGFVCRRPARYAAAQYDVSDNEWSHAPIPKPLRKVDHGLFRSLGATSDGRAVFELRDATRYVAPFDPKPREYWTYSPTSRRWAQLPAPAFEPESACLANDQLVALKVVQAPNGYVDPSLALFDLAAGAGWRTTPGNPEFHARYGVPVVTCLGAWIAVSEPVRLSEIFTIYDIAMNRWTTPEPHPVHPPFSQDRLWTGTELVLLQEVGIGVPGYAYDVRARSWRELPNAPALHAGALWNGSAIVGYRGAGYKPAAPPEPSGVFRYEP